MVVTSLHMYINGAGFPTMVDKLDPEIGEKTGPKPIMFGT